MAQTKSPGTLQASQPLKTRIADIRRSIELGAITGCDTQLTLDSESAGILLALFRAGEYLAHYHDGLSRSFTGPGEVAPMFAHALAARPGLQPPGK